MVIVATDAYKSLEVLDANGQPIRIDEGDLINFATETGESITGRITKISGKGDKTKLQIVPNGEQKEEIWSVIVMQDGSLKVVEEDSEVS